jgi:phosphoribosyl 1,2-cyclic phosphodiesterase
MMDMVRYAVVGSGSVANCYIIENAEYSILIDQGYTVKELHSRVKTLGFDLKRLRYIFFTHNHIDHSRGIAELAQYLDIPIVLHYKVSLADSGIERWDVKPNRDYRDDERGFAFQTFRTSHDAPHSLGFTVEISNFRFTVITDTGCILPGMRERSENSHVLFLEANYSSQLLEDGHYSDYLKRRVRGSNGHLSNHQAGQFLASLREPLLEQLFLCHLSSNNNTVEQVRSEVGEYYDFSIPTCICPRNESSAVFTLGLPAINKTEVHFKINDSKEDNYLAFF